MLKVLVSNLDHKALYLIRRLLTFGAKQCISKKAHLSNRGNECQYSAHPSNIVMYVNTVLTSLTLVMYVNIVLTRPT